MAIVLCFTALPKNNVVDDDANNDDNHDNITMIIIIIIIIIITHSANRCESHGDDYYFCDADAETLRATTT